MHQGVVETLPPHDETTEILALGVLLARSDEDQEVVGSAVEQLSASSFFLPKHATVYAAIRAVWDDCGRFDAILVGDHLCDTGRLKQVGGPNALSDLLEFGLNPLSILPDAVERLREFQLKRVIENLATNIARAAGNGSTGDDLVVMVSGLQEQVTDLRPKVPPSPMPLGITQPKALDPRVLGDDWFNNHVISVAESIETPPELAFGMDLAAISTACAGKFAVSPEAGYFEPVNTWTMTAMASGNRKTAAMRAATLPLIQYERDQTAQVNTEIKQAESRKKTIEGRINALRKRANQGDGTDMEDLLAQIDELQASIPEIPPLPRLFAQDVTPEYVAQMLVQHKERIAIISDEGGLIENMAGRYSNNGTANIDIFLQGHAGSPVRVDRGSRAAVVLDHPAITMGLSPQPVVLQRMAENREFRGCGLLARFLYLLPASRLGYRSLQPSPVPSHVTDAYCHGVRALLDLPPDVAADGSKKAHILRFSADAYDLWKDMQHRVEVELRPGGRFDHMTDWGSKMPGAVARIGALLHCVQHAYDRPEKHYIDNETMARAIALGWLFADHALAAFDLMGANPGVELARRVLDWIKRDGVARFTGREVYRHLRGSLKKASELQPAFDLLCDTHHIIRMGSETKTGRPSERFRVHPAVLTEGGVS